MSMKYKERLLKIVLMFIEKNNIDFEIHDLLSEREESFLKEKNFFAEKSFLTIVYQ